MAWLNMKRRAKRLSRATDGASAVEFAILAPVFLSLFFGVLQFGVWLQNYNAIRSVTLDGARAVMIEYQNDNTLWDLKDEILQL